MQVRGHSIGKTLSADRCCSNIFQALNKNFKLKMDSSKKNRLDILMEMYLDRQTMREEDTLLLLQNLSESVALRTQFNLAAAGLRELRQKRRWGHRLGKEIQT